MTAKDGPFSRSTPIGIGCAYLAAGSLTRYNDRLIDAAFDAGARHFDVAPLYGLGTAEYILGRALRGRRDAVTIVTKVGLMRPNVTSYKLVARSLLGPARKMIRGTRVSQSIIQATTTKLVLNFAPDYVQQSLEASLGALRTDYVDGFLLHMVTLEDLTDTLINALQALKTTGKTRTIGLATSRTETQRICARHPDLFDVVQFSWSALEPQLTHNSNAYRIIHRALMRSFDPLRQWFVQNPAACAAVSNACAADVKNPHVLVQCLVGAALVENKGGTVLVASRSIERTTSNIHMALDPKTTVLGAKFLSALRDQVAPPKVKE